MTRAVAEKGAELVKGIHKGSLGPAITVKQANGLVREVPFDEEEGATPVLIEAMILELDIEDSELREATKEHCLNFLKGWVEIVGTPEEAYDTMPLDKLYTIAEAFVGGYKAAFKKVQLYSTNPFHMA